VPQPRHLGKHQPEMADAPLHERGPLMIIKFGERDRNVALNSVPTSRVNSYRGRAQAGSQETGEAERKMSANFEKAPQTQIQGSIGGWRRHARV